MDFGTLTDLREDGMTDTVRLDVSREGGTVTCRVSREALEDLEAADAAIGQERGELLDLAEKHYDRLITAWMERIEFGPYEDNGSILLRSGDIR